VLSGYFLFLPLRWSLPDAGSGLGLEEMIEDVVGLEQPRAAQWTRLEGCLDLTEQPGYRVFRLRWPTYHMKMIFTLMLPNAIP